MAGTPKKRAREAAAAAAAAAESVPEAVREPEPPPNARTPTRARARGPAAPAHVRRDVVSGHEVRAAADRANARAVDSISKFIKPGVVLRIHRTRPMWCAGFIEDYPLQPGEGYAHVLAYMRSEHGGELYKIEVLGAGETLLYEGSIPIAGQPREQGRIINRARYQGLEEPERAPAVVQQPSGSSGADTIALLRFVLEQSQGTQERQLEAIKSMVHEQRESTNGLLNTIVNAREQQEQRSSFAGQLGELADGVRVLQRVQKQVFGAAAGDTGGGDRDEDLNPAVKVAREHFARAVMSQMFPAQQLAPNANAQQQPNLQQIPEARRSGKPNGRPRS